MSMIHIYMMRPEYYRIGSTEPGKNVDPKNLSATHIHVKDVVADDIESAIEMLSEKRLTDKARASILARGVWHSALTPGDIIVDEHESPWLIDFIAHRSLLQDAPRWGYDPAVEDAVLVLASTALSTEGETKADCILDKAIRAARAVRNYHEANKEDRKT